MILFSAAQAAPVSAQPAPHIFVLILENHSYDQVIGNPNLPTFNALVRFPPRQFSRVALQHAWE